MPADDPRDALAQGERELMARLWGMRLDHDALTLARNILADGSRYLSPAQAAEQDRLAAIGAAVERLTAWGDLVDIEYDPYAGDEMQPRWIVTLQGATVGSSPLGVAATLPAAIAAALDEPVTGEPDPMDDGDMCPNCVTPWKCNGPHLADQTRRHAR